jgi:hypothetical protein
VNEQPKYAEYIPSNHSPSIEPQPGQEAKAIPTSPLALSVLQYAGWAPITTVTFLAVDTVLFAGNVATMGLLLPFCVLSGGVLGFASYHWQRRAGDDHIMALTKALVVGLLTCIPNPAGFGVAGTAGIIGWIAKGRKQ